MAEKTPYDLLLELHDKVIANQREEIVMLKMQVTGLRQLADLQAEHIRQFDAHWEQMVHTLTKAGLLPVETVN